MAFVYITRDRLFNMYENFYSTREYHDHRIRSMAICDSVDREQHRTSFLTDRHAQGT